MQTETVLNLIIETWRNKRVFHQTDPSAPGPVLVQFLVFTPPKAPAKTGANHMSTVDENPQKKQKKQRHPFELSPKHLKKA